MYNDLYLGEKDLVERENVGLDLTKSDICPSFVEDLTAKDPFRARRGGLQAGGEDQVLKYERSLRVAMND
ncbi:hypothetical protein Tco_0026531 [Tanacetum coccineum]